MRYKGKVRGGEGAVGALAKGVMKWRVSKFEWDRGAKAPSGLLHVGIVVFMEMM